MFPEDLPRLEGVDFEKSLIALVEYLSDVSMIQHSTDQDKIYSM